MTRTPQSGFGMLEAIVALTLLAAAALPAALGLSSAMTSARRVEAALLELEMQTNALAALHVINPMLKPDGNLDLGPYRLIWSSTALDQSKPVVGPLGETGVWMVQPFEMSARIEDQSGLRARLTVRRAGFAPPP
jgi:hypothetical protein